jgi:hypothetical protein
MRVRQGETMNAEGWYQDPYRLHDARWFSDGTPTALVRDKGVESHEPPPNTSFTGQPDPIAEDASTNGDDLRRADQEGADDEIFDPDAAVGAAWDAFGESGGD